MKKLETVILKVTVQRRSPLVWTFAGRISKMIDDEKTDWEMGQELGKAKVILNQGDYREALRKIGLHSETADRCIVLANIVLNRFNIAD